MSFFTKLGSAGNSLFKKQVMPDVQSIFKKGGVGRKFSKMAGQWLECCFWIGTSARTSSSTVANLHASGDKTSFPRQSHLEGNALRQIRVLSLTFGDTDRAVGCANGEAASATRRHLRLVRPRRRQEHVAARTLWVVVPGRGNFYPYIDF